MFKLMNPLILPLLLSLLATGCGKHNKKKAEEEWRAPILSSHPIFLTKQSLNCREKYSKGDDIELMVYRFLRGASLLDNISLKDQIVENTIKSSTQIPIQSSVYDAESRTITNTYYDQVAGKYRERDSSPEEDIRPGRPLEICPETGIYSKNTFENAGINTSYHITKTYNKVQEILTPMGIKLDGISLKIGSKEQTLIRLYGGDANRGQISLYATDNAYYMRSKKEIVFLPHSQEYLDKNPSPPFWEVPMIASHEYSHHIFGSVILSSLKDILTSSNKCFKVNLSQNISIEKDTVGSDRDNSLKFAFRSINEGFSDLVAFYTLGHRDRGLKNIECFEKSREVDSSTFNFISFFYNEKKEFDYSAVSAMDSSTVRRYLGLNCNYPNYQEIHDVGAVFAYQANRLLSLVLDTDQEKLEVLLDWLKSVGNLESEITSFKSSKVLFRTLEFLYEKALEKKHLEKDAGRCDDVLKAFPGAFWYLCKKLK